MLENIIRPDNRLRLIAFVLIFALTVLTIGLIISNPTTPENITAYTVVESADAVEVTIEQPYTQTELDFLEEKLELQFPGKEIRIDFDFNFSEEKADIIDEALEIDPPAIPAPTNTGDNSFHGAYDR